MINVTPKIVPALDGGFCPAVLWNKEFLQMVNEQPGSREVTIRIQRNAQLAWDYRTRLFPAEERFAAVNLFYLERLLKFLMWAWGGPRVQILGAPELAAELAKIYSVGGARSFDFEFMGQQCFREPFVIESVAELSDLPKQTHGHTVGATVEGCRIGFDLGGSDRKCAALIDGEVVYSEEIKWDPYFQTDPNYHLKGIQHSISRAAAHLPRVDAIGGSAAGIYIDNEPRVASLFRGICREDFDGSVRYLFRAIQKDWDNLPFEIINDGDVTALAGAQSLGDNAVLGISMGTSEAVGYVDNDGVITGWLNELAFAPVDYREGAPVDEWSGDHGCGVQYFSQQAVGRLIPASGIGISEKIPLPERLEVVQERMRQGDERAEKIYRTIGTCFGYSIAHYREFYDFRHLLFLGRVSSGEGGDILLKAAEEVLEAEFPSLADQLSISMPDEKMKRHGQAVAAASLPKIEALPV